MVAPGIIRQLECEQRAANALGLPWTSRLFLPQRHPSPVCASPNHIVRSRLGQRLAYYSWLKAESRKHDVIILRYSNYDPFQTVFLIMQRKPVFTIHHTLEASEVKSRPGLILPNIQSMAEGAIGQISLRLVDGIIAVTREIIRYERGRSGGGGSPVFLYPNGFCLDRAVVPDSRRSKSVPELLFVAAHFAEWHGLDLLMDSIDQSDAEFVLHLVGQLSPSQLERVQKDRRCVIHGLLSSKEIMQLSSKCWIGLSSFALERKNMLEACPLKVREYLSMGLPVFAGHEDVFDKDAYYFQYGEPDITSILGFAQSTRGITKGEVALASREDIDKKALLNRLYSELSDTLGYA